MDTITGDDIQRMIRHWLETPVNGYLGSDYGSDIKALLQRAQSETRLADRFIAKLRRDVPVLDAMPQELVGLYATPEGIDRLRLTLEIAGRTYSLNELGNR
jgi:hypothetical protein